MWTKVFKVKKMICYPNEARKAVGPQILYIKIIHHLYININMYICKIIKKNKKTLFKGHCFWTIYLSILFLVPIIQSKKSSCDRSPLCLSPTYHMLVGSLTSILIQLSNSIKIVGLQKLISYTYSSLQLLVGQFIGPYKFPYINLAFTLHYWYQIKIKINCA